MNQRGGWGRAGKSSRGKAPGELKKAVVPSCLEKKKKGVPVGKKLSNPAEQGSVNKWDTWENGAGFQTPWDHY